MKKGTEVQSITYDRITEPWVGYAVMYLRTSNDFYFTEEQVRHDYDTFLRVDIPPDDNGFRLTFRVYKDKLKITNI